MIRNVRQNVALAVAALLIPAAGVYAEDQDQGEKVWGSASVGIETFFDGRRDSAKFDEYQETPNGFLGDLDLNYQNSDGYHFELELNDISQSDQSMKFTNGRYGEWKVELERNKIPHRYAYGAQSLYSGAGTGDLALSDILQSQLQNSASSSEVVDTLNAVEATTDFIDVGTTRTRDRGSLTLTTCDPYEVKMEVKRDQTKGTRPLGSGFGFSNAIELLEPRDFETMEYSLSGSYAKDDVFLSAAYYASVFDNHVDALNFDNPFSVADGVGSPAQGLFDLAPDNNFQSISFNGALKNLPLHSRLTAALSFGWMRQNDRLLPYTSNTALNPANGVPFDASTTNGLPTSKAYAAVNTSLFDVAWTARPDSKMDLKTYYRYYQRDNQADATDFPGYASFDSSWRSVVETTQPIQYDKHTAGIDTGYEVFDRSRLGFEYTFERMNRDLREVSGLIDNVFEVSFDNKSMEGVQLRASVQHADRSVDGGYDPFAPYGDEAQIPQLTFLKKFDEADRTKNSVNLLATVTPNDGLDITGSFQYGKSDYDESDFGLIDDTQHVYALDVAYAVADDIEIHGFYTFERHDSSQTDRQWSSGSLGDPFVTDTGFDSNSNWTANLREDVQTVGAGFQVALLPKVLTFKADYSLSLANGRANMNSPVGTPDEDANPVINPKDFEQLDDITIQSITPQLIWAIQKNMSLTFGYIWQRFDSSDFSKTGYSNVPTTSSGDYNGGLLMGTLPYEDYRASLAFAKLDYRF